MPCHGAPAQKLEIALSWKLETYDPINALKPVADNIWIVDGPVISFKSVPFSTRMTVVRLGTGELFIHSPTELTGSLKREIDALGRVRHLVSPNKIHYWWIGAWGEHYPDAQRWASPGAREASAKQGWDFTDDLAEDAPSAWRAELEQLIVRGGRFLEEVVFFHQASRSLILADLIENFEACRVKSPLMRFLLTLAGNLDPDGKLPIDLRLSFWGRHEALRPAVQRMIDWQPERIILAHGRCYEGNASAELRRAFRWVKGL